MSVKLDALAGVGIGRVRTWIRLASVLILLLVFILSAVPRPALAQPEGTIGVGLSWHDETIIIKDEFGEGCLSYGLYNPFDIDVTATLVAHGDIKELLSRIEPETIFVPAGTGPKETKRINVCFKPKVLRFPFCKNETWTGCFDLGQWVFQFPFYPTTIKGSVLASYVRGEQPVAGTGSHVRMSISAPLELRIGDIGVFYRFVAFVILISLTTVAFIFRNRLKVFYLRVRGKTEEQRKLKLKQLQEKIKKLKGEEKRLKRK
jgi:hypothetical protein